MTYILVVTGKSSITTKIIGQISDNKENENEKMDITTVVQPDASLIGHQNLDIQSDSTTSHQYPLQQNASMIPFTTLTHLQSPEQHTDVQYNSSELPLVTTLYQHDPQRQYNSYATPLPEQQNLVTLEDSVVTLEPPHQHMEQQQYMSFDEPGEQNMDCGGPYQHKEGIISYEPYHEKFVYGHRPLNGDQQQLFWHKGYESVNHKFA